MHRSDDAGPATPEVTIQPGTKIQIREGTLSGKTNGGMREFLGIPYAKPPIGELRWKAPEPFGAWDGERSAERFGATCPQPALLVDPATTNEDCLFLNVSTPATAPDKPLPTMVWLHGGGFAIGAGSQPDYAAKRLVEQGGVVLVTLNYRLGALGGLVHPALTAESGRGTSGNYGVQDQTLALEWVQRNIIAFGGDPHNVTVFGESAGGVSTCVQMASPAAHGLFQRVMMESGVCLGFGKSLAEAEAKGQTFASGLGCTGTDALACLRGKTPDELVAADGNDAVESLLHLTWAPIADGVVLPADAKDLSSSAHVPVLLGTNHDEARLFFASPLAGTPISTEAAYDSLVTSYFPDDAAAVLARYPIADFADPGSALSALVTDALFVCPTRRMARAAAAEGMDTFLYGFEHVPASLLLPGVGACHTTEMPYVFGNSSLLVALQPSEEPLEDAMLGFWTRFAATGNPNTEGESDWPRYTEASDAHLALDTPLAKSSGLKKPQCDFLDTIPPPKL